MTRDWTQEYFNISGNEKDAFVELKKENEVLKAEMSLLYAILDEYEKYHFHQVGKMVQNNKEIQEMYKLAKENNK